MSILDRVQRVLALYAEGAAELSFTDVAQRLSMPKSTASRLLNQMQYYGMLDQDAASRRYRPGLLLSQAVRAGLAEFCTLNPTMPVLGLPEGAALRVRGAAITLVGPHDAPLFLGSNEPRVFQPGAVEIPA